MAEPARERTDLLAHYEAMRYGMFLHFDVNTFRDKPACLMSSLSKGSLPPAEIYCPTDLEVDQWISTAEAAGMRYTVLTVKHWLGFALWDSKYTDYDVAASGNKTDVVAEFVNACRCHSVAPCFLYTVAQDMAHRRDKGMGEDEWYELAFNQLGELLTRYGPIAALWFDGVAPVPPGRLQEAYDVVKSHQPDCLVVVNQGPGSNGSRVRTWPTDVLAAEPTLPLSEGHNLRLQYQGATYYLPLETCETSAQGTFSKGWFWEPDQRPKEVDRELVPLYNRVTERGANLLLNVALDRRGKVPAATVACLTQLRRALESG